MVAKIRPVVAGNWKMNGTSASLGELRAIARGFDGGLSSEAEGYVCVPATLLSRAAETVSGSTLRIGGQDCHSGESGAHTGDISAEMLRDAGGHCVIVGHSERRTDHGETSSAVSEKAKAAYRAGLVAVICIGETRAEREEGRTLDVLAAQLAQSVPAAATAQNSIVAYEPVWAIGTGLTPGVDDIATAHAHIRTMLREKLGPDADRTRILYGGSVKPSNALELLSVDNVNGALVGGASLKASDFLGIVEAYRQL